MGNEVKRTGFLVKPGMAKRESGMTKGKNILRKSKVKMKKEVSFKNRINSIILRLSRCLGDTWRSTFRKSGGSPRAALGRTIKSDVLLSNGKNIILRLTRRIGGIRWAIPLPHGILTSPAPACRRGRDSAGTPQDDRSATVIPAKAGIQKKKWDRFPFQAGMTIKRSGMTKREPEMKEEDSVAADFSPPS